MCASGSRTRCGPAPAASPPRTPSRSATSARSSRGWASRSRRPRTRARSSSSRASRRSRSERSRGARSIPAADLGGGAAEDLGDALALLGARAASVVQRGVERVTQVVARGVDLAPILAFGGEEVARRLHLAAEHGELAQDRLGNRAVLVEIGAAVRGDAVELLGAGGVDRGVADL